MKTLKVYLQDNEFVIERINQFGTSFKRRFLTKQGLKEGLDAYNPVIHEYKIEISEDVWELVIHHISKVFKQGAKDCIIEEFQDEQHYLQVESNYIDPKEGKGQKDAVNFFMGVKDAGEIEFLIAVSTEEARKFANAILQICNEIDGKGDFKWLSFG